MQCSILATLLGLAATSIAVAVPDDASTLSKKAATGIIVRLCNDFHGGKPCETHDVKPRQCSNVDSNLYKYVSSVKIGGSTEYCKFYSEKDCNGKNITVYYPGDVDLAVNYNFDNQVVSYYCAYNTSTY